ncbi:MAG TPA: hypothetical protein VNM43_11905 [Dehalococcoidia bacterium]|nr:hypothetical protein [Dehalococcoidia bacterium]
MAADLLNAFAARLAFRQLAGQYGRSFSSMEAAAERPNVFVAEGDGARVAMAVARLWEEDDDWIARREEMAERIRASLRGSYLLWMPPGADLPSEEPAATDFVRRVSVAGAPLAPGARLEVELPARVRLAKTREEGGYASVVGGLGRYWTAITERVSGTFVLDTTAIKRAPLDERTRDSMFDRIAQLATQVDTGHAVEFELWDSWTLQRLDEGDGFVIVGAPPSFDPTDGAAIRRLLRRRLDEAAQTLGSVDADARVVAFVAIVEFAEHEGVSSALRSISPTLYAPFELLLALADGEVRVALQPGPLPWS